MACSESFSPILAPLSSLKTSCCVEFSWAKSGLTKLAIGRSIWACKLALSNSTSSSTSSISIWSAFLTWIGTTTWAESKSALKRCVLILAVSVIWIRVIKSFVWNCTGGVISFVGVFKWTYSSTKYWGLIVFAVLTSSIFWSSVQNSYGIFNGLITSMLAKWILFSYLNWDGLIFSTFLLIIKLLALSVVSKLLTLLFGPDSSSVISISSSSSGWSIIFGGCDIKSWAFSK